MTQKLNENRAFLYSLLTILVMTNECHDLKSGVWKNSTFMCLTFFFCLNSSKNLSRLFDTVFEIVH